MGDYYYYALSCREANKEFLLGFAIRKYHLEVVQHPECTAELAGAALLSRLPLSPPLIVQVTVEDSAGNINSLWVAYCGFHGKTPSFLIFLISGTVICLFLRHTFYSTTRMEIYPLIWSKARLLPGERCNLRECCMGHWFRPFITSKIYKTNPECSSSSLMSAYDVGEPSG